MDEKYQQESWGTWLVKAPFRLAAYPFRYAYKCYYPDPSMSEAEGIDFINILRGIDENLNLDVFHKKNLKKLAEECRTDRVPFILVIYKGPEQAMMFQRLLND